MKKAVIFDFDDTLFESRAQKWAQHKHVAKKFFNIDLTDETILKHWGKPIHILAKELYQNSDTWENIHPILRSTRKDFPKKDYKESLSIFTKIIDQGIKVGIVSAATNLDVIDDLERFKFPIARITIIQGADKTLVHKPDPDVFLPVFNRLKEEGIEKKDIVYIGDSLDDLRASRGAGIDFIAVTTGLYSKEQFQKAGASIVVSNIEEILDFIID